jgi:FlaA1/EpsC-like NDP-sugar epimerase
MGRRFRNRYLLLLDALLSVASPFAAYALRFEGWDWPQEYRYAAIVYAMIALPLRLGVYLLFGLYRRLWRHASVAELERIIAAGAFASLLCIVLGAFVLPATGMITGRVPFSVLFLDAYMSVAAIAGPRLFARVLGGQSLKRRREDARRVLIAGAGNAGQLIVRELLNNPDLGLDPVGFVDDDGRKHYHRLNGLPVFGALSDLQHIAREHNVQTVIIAMPTASGRVVREVVRLSSETGIETRIVPGLSEIISGRVGVTSLREVRIEDLLRREPIATNLEAVGALATGRGVLVTGAGGSIGSELCRQLATVQPSSLILVGHGENSIFDIQHELQEKYPSLNVVPIIADIRDRARMLHIFQAHRPHAVFHAAAHKHVPLMEENLVEAITNNVAGTLNVVDAAIAAGSPHFVLISTDKAVRPTSVMGATKRVAEQIVQCAALAHDRKFAAVRFGNVLGSRGSVVPTFLRQIRAGGPITITHPEMRRYFMTIPEAVQLVLQAGALGQGSEVFVLDMGEPVLIMDLAADLIRLSGLHVGTDVEIRVVGSRPGEKLYEEMFFGGENVVPTGHPKVLRARSTSLPNAITAQITNLISAAHEGKPDDELRRLLQRLVPDFTQGPRSAPAELPSANELADVAASSGNGERSRVRIDRSSGALSNVGPA